MNEKQLIKNEDVFAIPMIEMPEEVEIRATFQDGQLRLWLNDVEIVGVREINLNGLTYGGGPNVRIRALRTGIEGIQAETTWTYLHVPEFSMQAKGVKDA